jgi:hypothetical protein
MSARANAPRAGFALPLALLVMALLTASVIAAYSTTSAEVVTNNAIRAQDHAYHLAEAGLQQFMLTRGQPGCTNCVADPAVADSEWTRIALPGGYADVVATRVRPKRADTIPALFFIRSKGVDTTYATRIVGQYATFGTATIKPLAAWTSLNGIRNPMRVLLPNILSAIPGTGTDQCGGASPVAGFMVPGPAPADRQYITVTTGSILGAVGTPHPTGSPGVDSTRLLDTLERRSGIDWNAIQNFDAIPADITIPSGTFPSSAAFADANYWPVIRVKGNWTTTNSGRGLLIVDGDLSFESGDGWDGIVLVGGRLKLRAGGTIAGAVLSGLDRTLPDSANPPAGATAYNDSIVPSNFLGISLAYKKVNYHSCNAIRAAESLKMYFAWSNTWLDNVAVW